MTTQNPYPGPIDDDDDPMLDDTADDSDGILDPILGGDDGPLDPDLDDDQIESADADERAATEGTLDVDDRP